MIDDILQIDTDNVEVTKKNWAIFDPELPEAINDANRLHEVMAQAFFGTASDFADIECLNGMYQENCSHSEGNPLKSRSSTLVKKSGFTRCLRYF